MQHSATFLDENDDIKLSYDPVNNIDDCINLLGRCREILCAGILCYAPPHLWEMS